MTQQISNKSIEFSFNWNNKLNFRSFSTIRRSDRFNVGDRVEVYLKLRKMGDAVVIAKHATTFGGITDGTAYIDTGYDATECRNIIQKMYKDQVFTNRSPIFLYILAYVEKEIPQEPGTLFG